MQETGFCERRLATVVTCHVAVRRNLPNFKFTSLALTVRVPSAEPPPLERSYLAEFYRAYAFWRELA
jgi:hypothetical protein